MFVGDKIATVFEKASQKKAWDQFTKPQRKTIGQWKESAHELRRDLTNKINLVPILADPVPSDNEESEGGREPPVKKIRADTSKCILLDFINVNLHF